MYQKYKKFLILSVVAIFSIIFSSEASAQKSNTFLENVASIIYRDCDSRVTVKLQDPGEEKTLLDILTILNQKDFYEWTTKNLSGGAIANVRSNGDNGSNLIECAGGKHYLDIEGDKWFWDGERIEVPRIVQNDVVFNGDVINSSVSVGYIPIATVNGSSSTTTPSTTTPSTTLTQEKPLSNWNIFWSILGQIAIIVTIFGGFVFIFKVVKWWKKRNID